MRVLILGSGAREHALSWKLSGEIGKENVFISPGNGGTEKCGKNISIEMMNFEGLHKFCIENEIDTIIPGSEEVIAAGVRDFFENKSVGINVFSPDKHAGQLESSKSFAKLFMQKQGIPTAAYQSFTSETVDAGIQFLDTLNAPYVLKADGLAAGKGVLILDSLEEAKSQLKEMLLENKFGDASSTVVIEEFLDGIEFSVFAITDGEDYVLLPEAKDYKRIGEGDKGLNTGGMGAVSPVPFFNEELRNKTIKEVIEPTIEGIKDQGLNYRGFIFFGLIAVNNNPYVIEYNVRMGDPETEVVVPRLDESLSELIKKGIDKKLQTRTAKAVDGYCTTIFSVSGGYPEKYEKGKKISISIESETLFHAGTKSTDEGLVTSGGRVLASTAFGKSLDEALKNSYELNKSLTFEGKTFRSDIGQDLLSLTA